MSFTRFVSSGGTAYTASQVFVLLGMQKPKLKSKLLIIQEKQLSFKESAKLKVPVALRNVGNFYLYGTGVK